MYKGSGHPMPKGGPLAIQRSTFVQKRVDVESDKSNSNVEPAIRKDFPESWIFDALDGDDFE